MPNIENLSNDGLLRAAFNAMSEGMALHRLVYDATGVAIDYLILDVNPSFEKQTGLSKEAVIGKLASKAYGAGNAPFLDIYSKVVLTQHPFKFEQYFPPLLKHFIINVFALGKDQFVTVFEDITERKILEDRWKFALEGAGDGVWDWNIQTGEATFSKRYKEMLGYAENEIRNVATEWSDRVHPEDMPNAMSVIQAHLDGKTPTAKIEFRMLCKNGGWKWILGRGMVVSRDKDGKPLRLVGTNTDITDRKKAEEEIYHLAFYDALTNLPNRRLFIDRLSQAMATSKRSGSYGALMFLDLDNFKTLNDLHGHDAGDLLLIEAANRLKSCIREMDTVARFGGDEFVVILSELDVDKTKAITQTNIVAKKICTALSSPYRLVVKHERKADANVEHHCTISVGVAMFVNHEESQDEIIKRADATMYQAKNAGRNRILFFEEKD
jgi:diguanylate cyclase (GGDEF)-like protein/PAS domain S-box-containing protein